MVESRQKAQAFILAGQVLVDEQRVDKVGQKVDADAEIRIKGEHLKYASRAGLKLEAALAEFKLTVTESICLDVGASTGGFTDCLLQHGARKVVALDVGHSQLLWRLRQDSRVEVREKVNARYLKLQEFDQPFDLITVDVSFISLTKIIPTLKPLLKTSGKLITLIKPQFEVGRGEVGKGGIVTDSEKQQRVVREIVEFAESIGFTLVGLITSPIKGGDGNVEFLACLSLYFQ